MSRSIEAAVKGIAQRIAELPPEKRSLLLERLGKAGLSPALPVSPAPPPVRPRLRGPGVRPLSFAQERLWFLDQLAPASGQYNVPTALRLRGPIDRRLFASALRAVTRRHEVLRVSFRCIDGEPVQTVEEEVHLDPTEVDLSSLPQPERDTEAERLARDEALRPFDLTQAPLLRACWVDLLPGDQLLLFTLHHIVCDGWSVDILTRELVETYRELAAGRYSPLQDPPLQYADYVEWQRERLQGDLLEELLGYWRHQLRGARAAINLRGALPEAPGWESRSADESFELSGAVAAALRSLGRDEQATPFMVLTALFSLLLQAESGQEDLCIGANAAHRGDLEMEGLVGFFINQVVLRVRTAGLVSFRALICHVRDVVQDAFAHQELPFEKLVEELCPERGASRNPLFRVKVDFQEDQPPVELPGLELSALEVIATPLRCDLLLRGTGSSGGGLAGVLSYDANRFRAGTVKRMTSQLVQIAGIAAVSPDLPLPEVAQRASQATEGWRVTEREWLDRIGVIKLKSTRRKSVRF